MNEETKAPLLTIGKAEFGLSMVIYFIGLVIFAVGVGVQLASFTALISIVGIGLIIAAAFKAMEDTV